MLVELQGEPHLDAGESMSSSAGQIHPKSINYRTTSLWPIINVTIQFIMQMIIILNIQRIITFTIFFGDFPPYPCARSIHGPRRAGWPSWQRSHSVAADRWRGVGEIYGGWIYGAVDLWWLMVNYDGWCWLVDGWLVDGWWLVDRWTVVILWLLMAKLRLITVNYGSTIMAETIDWWLRWWVNNLWLRMASAMVDVDDDGQTMVNLWLMMSQVWSTTVNDDDMWWPIPFEGVDDASSCWINRMHW